MFDFLIFLCIGQNAEFQNSNSASIDGKYYNPLIKCKGMPPMRAKLFSNAIKIAIDYMGKAFALLPSFPTTGQTTSDCSIQISLPLTSEA